MSARRRARIRLDVEVFVKKKGRYALDRDYFHSEVETANGLVHTDVFVGNGPNFESSQIR